MNVVAKTKVLVVDDSSFLRKSIVAILEADQHLEVIGTASNGLEGVQQVEKLSPDVVTMDIEMPVMDGITAVKRIMETSDTPILMLSSLTTKGAAATFEALEAGALDYLPKTLSDISSDTELAKRQLCARVRMLGSRGKIHYKENAAPTADVVKATSVVSSSPFNISDYKLLVIGTSTGGPAALQKILPFLNADFPLPIVVVQHMPSSFTQQFSERMDSVSKLNVREAKNGETVKPGQAVVAPGGSQLIIDKGGLYPSIRIKPAKAGDIYKPCVDITLGSIASDYCPNVLTMILTGMGSDGCEGAKRVHKLGARIWAQDRDSSVIYGMPMAVANEGIVDRVLSLSDIATVLNKGR